MYAITIETTFPAHHALQMAHFAEQSHLHQWRVAVTVAAEQLDPNGLVMDFHQLQRSLEQILAPLVKLGDLNHPDSPLQDNPSTERLCRYLFDQLTPTLPSPVELTKVTVWETPTCCAAYEP